MTNLSCPGTPRFCPFCSSELSTKYVDDRKRFYCETCEEVIWQNPKPAAGVVVTGNEETLLIKRGIEPDKGKWSIPAGFLEQDEEPEKGAARELKEETSVEANPDELELFDTVFIEQPGRGYVLVLVYLISKEEVEGGVNAGDDAEKARYWTLQDLEESGEEMREPYLEPVREVLKVT